MKIEHRLSPKYRHEKLENPSREDTIDVFEDMWLSYVILPVEILLRHPNCEIPAMSILSSYFEAIWSYISGQDSEGKSKAFFVNGFLKVFGSIEKNAEIPAKAIYKNLRCGLAHTALPTHKVNYSREGAKPFLLTYPKNKDGTLNLQEPPRSIVVNPVLFYKSVKAHFADYVKELRSDHSQELLDAFDQTVHRLWGFSAGENIIAMTEAEFLGRT